jgi:TRAP transporter TAXI family solute receptor
MQPSPDDRNDRLARLLRHPVAIGGGALVVLAALGIGLWTLLAVPRPVPEIPGDRFFTIATGSVSGTYYPVGDMIAGIISHPVGSLRCASPDLCGPLGLVAVARASDGSVHNATMVERGEVQSALAQADVVSWAYLGEGIFADRPAFEKLRVIANLYPETIHLVVRREAGIESLADLEGRRVSIDRPQSGTHANALLILRAAGVTVDQMDLRHFNVDRAAEQISAGELDAFFFIAGAPVTMLQQLARQGLIDLLPIAGAGIDEMRQDHLYFHPALIPAGTYEGIGEVRTMSVGALWIVNRDVDDDLVYSLTRALWNPFNQRALAESHPKGRLIRFEEAVTGVPIPLHPGAERYYIERGLLVD